MFAMAAAAVALGILFSSETFPLTPKLRLLLSLFATTTIGFFSEFRNEGKFYFKSRVHFFGPSTWVHSGLNQIASSLGDFLYRMEYSHWNDFLMGPAIVSVLFLVAAMKIYRAFQTQGSVSMSPSTSDFSTELDHALQFTRIFMNVGLFWFFIQAWTEKAGYLSNPHSNDEIDLPFEFAGTMLGFWMVRVLTKPFEQRIEKFRSTFFIDFACSGVIGLLYTFVVGPLTEGIARNVAHTLHSVIPGPLELHEYTSLQQHVRPFELLLLAAAMWWGLNWSSNRDQLVVSGPYEEPQSESKWHVLITTAKVLGVAIAYLVILASTLSASEPQGIAWTVAETGIAIVVATGVLLMLKRANRRGFMSLLGMRDETSGD